MSMIVRIIIGAVIGGGLGFLYQRLVGCPTGGCPLTSNPWITTIYGMGMGALVGSSFTTTAH